MDGLGLLVVMAFIILIIVIFDKQSCPSCVKEGFESTASPYWDSYASKPQQTQPYLQMPVIGPAAANLTDKKEPTGYTGISDLPSVPVANLGEVNSLPYQDPRFEKVSTQMLRQLKQDMDGFSANEVPYMKDRSDPEVKLPLTRFKGDYQRVKDELKVVDRTPGFQSQLAVEDLNAMAANLRFLQRTYRLYAANEMVPAPEGGLSKVGIDSVEGFASGAERQGRGTNASEGFAAGAMSVTDPNYNIIKVMFSIYKAYAKKIKGVTINSFEEMMRTNSAPPEMDLIQSNIDATLLKLNGYISNKDEFIKKIGFDILDRNIITSYLDSIVYNAPELDKNTYMIIVRIGLLDYVNTKYSLGVTAETIAKEQYTPEINSQPPPPFDTAVVKNSQVYKKYFPTSSSVIVPPVVPVAPSYPTDPANQPVSVEERNVKDNIMKFMFFVNKTYAKKIKGDTINSENEFIPEKHYAPETASLFKINPNPDSSERNAYISNKVEFIKNKGLDFLDRNILISYLDSIVYNAPELDKTAYQLLVTTTLSDYINIKYSLGVTAESIAKEQIPRVNDPPVSFNTSIVKNNSLYKKYFPTSSSVIVPPVVPVAPSYPTDPANQPITVSELNLLRQKLAVEILRLQASGTTDPVLNARVNVFKKIQTAVEGISKQVQAGSMRPQDIPIRKRDYDKFLPALGDQSAGVAGLLSSTGYPSLSSLFNAYDRGDVTGPQLTQDLFKHYADTLLQGLSYKMDISYTSPNEVAARQAEATKASADLANSTVGNQVFAGLSGAFQTTHPMTFDGARGAFDAYTRELDMQGFQGDLNLGSQGLPDGTYGRQSVMPSSAKAASFDWKERAQTICDNVKKMGMNPADFGCQANPQGSAQNTDFSWRGYSKMVCNRLKTVADPGVPEQVGCPPDSWRGWRT